MVWKGIKIALSDSRSASSSSLSHWCVDPGNRPQHLAGRKRPSSGKAGPPGKLSLTFVVSCPGSPFYLYLIPEVSNPGSPVSLSHSAVTQGGPRLLLALGLDGLYVWGQWQLCFLQPSLHHCPREVCTVSFLLPQATSLPECWLDFLVYDFVSSCISKAALSFLDSSRPGALRMQIGLWEKDSSQ